MGLLFFLLPLGGQHLSTLRERELSIDSDTIRPDSMMILPGSLFLFDQGNQLIHDSLYHLDSPARALIVHPSLRGKVLTLRYRVIPSELFNPYRHKDIAELRARDPQQDDPFRISAGDLPAIPYYTYAELNKRGSLSRGIAFGNNQDVVVNSNLNLQLTGKLSDNVNIVAAISDNNIPIQPGGYSQQINDFDRVYIELFNEKHRLTAGDFELEGSPGGFMDFYKRAKGMVYRGNFNPVEDPGVNMTTTVSGAVAKGKYTRNAFTGIEGNQGPYRLHGRNHEQFIIILAGSEKLYIDGKLLTRGQNNDYIIDYNTAELTFTPAQPITKDKRIIVEFEYSERSYARFLIYTSNEIRTRGGRYWVNAYSEQDDRNQTLQQGLTEDDKVFLSRIGNDIQSAIVPRADSVGFSPDEVRYRKKDSLVSGVLHRNVYLHSIDPELAVYRLRFSFVGEGKGDYIPVSSAANGKVYRWVAPENGTRQGAYEPVVLLVTPRKKQVLSVGGSQQLSDLTRAGFEAAVTNNDPNTYSGMDASENMGYAVKLSVDQDFLRRDTSRIRLLGSVHYRHTSRNFDPVERFRAVEFERDWNLGVLEAMPEHMAGGSLRFRGKEAGTVGLHAEYLRRGGEFEGMRNHLEGVLRFGRFEVELDGSLMNSSSPLQETKFIRHRASIARHFPFMVVGMREEGEQNLWREKRSDSLTGHSFGFQQYEFFLSRPDSVQNRAYISYKNRRDFLPWDNAMRFATLGQDLNIGMGWMDNPANRLNFMLTMRDLNIRDSSLVLLKPQRNVLGRIEHSMQLAGGVISTSTFYEVGSGLETRKDYSYLEVPAGQGVYTWIDYNGNGVKELDEFETAQFPDEARYIRIYLPSGDYFTVYANQFNHTLHLDPARKWNKHEGIRKIASYFSDQFAYRAMRKSSTGGLGARLNPFYSGLESRELITYSGSLRNNLSFNRTGRIFGSHYIYQKSMGKTLLANGFDTRTLESHAFMGRLNPGQGITITNELDRGTKTYQSELFSNRDFQILYLANAIKLQYQVNMTVRFEGEYGYKSQSNKLDDQESMEHKLGAELRYSLLDKGVLTARLNYINLEYSAEPGSPVAYEMLGSLLPGHNGTWVILFQRSISGGIELNMEYAGRVSESRAVVHTGSMQVRANF
jgi:hypothetical protein